LKIVIVGAGEVGFHIANHLTLENKEVVVIDKNADAIRRVSDNLDVQVVRGSGSSPVVLEEAGIRNAEVLLAVTDSDEANLVACLVANMLSPSTKKLARVRGGDFDRYHDHFRENAPHIDTIINPEIEVVKTIASMLSVPGAADVGEFADGRIKFIGIYLDSDSPLAGVKLSEIPDKITHVRLLIAAVVREEELIIPRGDDCLMPGDLVYFISEKEKLQETLAVFESVSGFTTTGASILTNIAALSKGFLYDGLLKLPGYPVSLGSMREAKLNTKKNPHMSVTVVRSGPDANAGSERIVLRINGTSPPKLTATSVLAAKETPTTSPSQGFPFQRMAAPPSRIPSAMPLMRPIADSLASTRTNSRGRTKPSVNSRILTATA
jgi:Trk K+ transport system NAD-binding subunit